MLRASAVAAGGSSSLVLRGGMGWDGMRWNGMRWDGMGWDGMGWDGMGAPGAAAAVLLGVRTEHSERGARLSPLGHPEAMGTVSPVPPCPSPSGDRARACAGVLNHC